MRIVSGIRWKVLGSGREDLWIKRDAWFYLGWQGKTSGVFDNMGNASEKYGGKFT